MERYNGKIVKIFEIHDDDKEHLCYMRVKHASTDNSIVVEGVSIIFNLDKNTGRLVLDTKKDSITMTPAQYEELQVLSDKELSGIASAVFELALYKAGAL